MKIKTKLFIIFSVAISSIFIIGIVSFWYFSDGLLKNSLNDRLNIITHSKIGHLNGFLRQQKEKNRILAKNDHWEELLSGLFDKERFSYDEFYKYSGNVLNDNLHREYYEIFILDKNGEIIISTDDNRVGFDESNSDYFMKAKENIFVSGTFAFDNNFVFAISSPILDGISGEHLGNLVTFINMRRVYDIIGDVFGIGDTGAIYLINKDYYLITPFRYDENVIFKQKIETPHSKRCFQKDIIVGDKLPPKYIDYIHEPFLNFKGDNVVGSHVTISDMQWCLIVEESVEEVFIPTDKLSSFLFNIILVTLVIILIVSRRVGSMVGGPLEKLRKMIEIVEKGNYDYNVRLGSKDEVGLLSESFANMIDMVKKSNKEVGVKIKEQTEEIIKTSKYLEQQQTALLNVLEDVEEEKHRTQVEKDKLDTILQSIGDGVFVVDKNLRILIFNKIASRISGFSQEDVIGEKYNKILKFELEGGEKIEKDFIQDSLRTGEIKTMEENSVLIKKDGTTVSVADSAAPIKDEEGKVIGVVVVFRDVSLSRKIDKMKSEFVSVASHQLRTPLTGIQWVTERLLKISDQLPEKEKGYVNDIYFSSRRLSRLVDDLLSVSRIEGGRLVIKPEEINVVKFVQGYLEESKPVYDKKELTVDFSNHPDKLIGFLDRSSLRNIIQSIISNAFEYTPQKGKVTIEIEQKEDNFIFKVSDTGIGIPTKDQETIFEKFTRGANAQVVKTDGTGLGLYITQQTVLLLGGKIWLESEENKGTTFFVELPIKITAKDVSKDVNKDVVL